MSLGQGCSKSSAKEERQDPGIIGLKSCGPIVDKKSQNPVKIGLNCVSAKVCYTRPKVAPPSVVQHSSEPVTGGRCEGSRPAGQE